MGRDKWIVLYISEQGKLVFLPQICKPAFIKCCCERGNGFLFKKGKKKREKKKPTLIFFKKRIPSGASYD